MLRQQKQTNRDIQAGQSTTTMLSLAAVAHLVYLVFNGLNFFIFCAREDSKKVYNSVPYTTTQVKNTLNCAYYATLATSPIQIPQIYPFN